MYFRYKTEVHYCFYKVLIIYCIFKGFHEKLDCLTIVSLRSFFAKTTLISLSLIQFADFVCKLRAIDEKSIALFSFK